MRRHLAVVVGNVTLNISSRVILERSQTSRLLVRRELLNPARDITRHWPTQPTRLTNDHTNCRDRASLLLQRFLSRVPQFSELSAPCHVLP